MYSPEQVLELVEAAYDRGFSEGARNAYDTVEFLDEFEAGLNPYSSPESSGSIDATEYDALYLEAVGQKVDALIEQVQNLERWNYATPKEDPEISAEHLNDRIRYLENYIWDRDDIQCWPIPEKNWWDCTDEPCNGSCPCKS